MHGKYSLFLSATIALLAVTLWLADPQGSKLPAHSDARVNGQDISQNASAPSAAEPSPARSTALDPSAQAQTQTQPASTAGTTAPANPKPPSIHLAAEHALAEVRRLLSATDFSKQSEQHLAELQDQLLVLAATDEATRAQLLQWLKDAPGGQLGNFALAILDQLQRPEVLQLGMQLTQSTDRTAILAGLDILGQQGNVTPEVLDLAAPLLSSYRDDPEVLKAALQTVTGAHAEPDAVNARGLRNAFLDLSGHPDPAVRSASLFGLARNAGNSEDLQPVIEALDRSDPEDRITAAMALEQSSDLSASLRNAFLAHMNNPDEVWEVRRMAADALGRFSVDDSAQNQIARFRAEQALVVNEDQEPGR